MCEKKEGLACIPYLVPHNRATISSSSSSNSTKLLWTNYGRYACNE